MKITYYSYCLSDEDKAFYSFDLRKIFENFCKKSTKSFRALFTTEFSERLYLFPLYSDIYLFVVAKDNELIKAIDNEKFEHKDIYSKLEDNESLGFASYIIIKDCYYGLGSTFYGPKNNKVIAFVNKLFEYIHGDTLKFISKAIPTSATSHEVAAMEYIGKTFFELKPTHSIIKAIATPFGFALDADDYDAIEITIRPKRSKGGMPGKDFTALSNSIESGGISKFMARAKSEIGELVTDYYIVGHGNVSDFVITKNEREIVNQIIDRHSRNSMLSALVQGIKNDKDIIKNSSVINPLLPYNRDNAWDNLMESYQDKPTPRRRSKANPKS